MSERVVIATDGGPWAYIISPFSAKDAIRTIPRRRWSASGRKWEIPRECVKTAERVLTAAGYAVTVDDGRVKKPQSAVDLFVAVLDVSEDHAKDVYRRLQQALHPDAGGNLELSKALNEAWRRRS